MLATSMLSLSANRAEVSTGNLRGDAGKFDNLKASWEKVRSRRHSSAHIAERRTSHLLHRNYSAASPPPFRSPPFSSAHRPPATSAHAAARPPPLPVFAARTSHPPLPAAATQGLEIGDFKTKVAAKYDYNLNKEVSFSYDWGPPPPPRA